MTIVKVHNDGKEKCQSFEAWIDDIDCERGYGPTAHAAIQEYEQKLNNYQARLAVACLCLESEQFETIEVDYSGREI